VPSSAGPAKSGAAWAGAGLVLVVGYHADLTAARLSRRQGWQPGRCWRSS